MITWMLIDVLKQGKPTLIGACTGVVAGLVGITPAAGFVSIGASFIIGITVAPVCYFGIIIIKKALKIDDSLDAFGCHGIGGIWGGILTGLFVTPELNLTEGLGGLFYGGGLTQLISQIEGILITIAIVVAGTLIAAAITKVFTPLRVSKHEELNGMDISQHGEIAYPSFTGLD
jgi:Amt family ammonium transporter